MWPALVKQGTSRQRHLTDFSEVYDQLDQYFQFVEDMLLEEVISEPLIYYASTSIKTCLIQGLDKVMQLWQKHTLLVCSLLSEVSQMSLATCSLLRQIRADHIIIRYISKRVFHWFLLNYNGLCACHFTYKDFCQLLSPKSVSCLKNDGE